MCQLRAMSSYQTSDELMMALNSCFASCPSIGTLLRIQADCPVCKNALNRHLELLQKEDARRGKKATVSFTKELQPPPIEVMETAGERELVFAGTFLEEKKLSRK